MRQAICFRWLALACLLGVTWAAADPAVTDDSSSSSVRQLLQTGSIQSSKPGCVCPMMYAPVCGQDGKTHSNQCTAKCRGVTVAYAGECTPTGTNGHLNSAPSSSSSSSKKQEPCACAKVYMPVCSSGKKTYANSCEAKCAGAHIESNGPCPESSAAGTIKTVPSQVRQEVSGSIACNCDTAIKEVCGEDGKTYSNKCLAQCAGSKVRSEGSCKVEIAPVPAPASAPVPAPTSGSTPAPKPKCHAPCWWPYKPVCGADGRTYTNECRAACKGVDIVSQGSCRSQGWGGLFGRKPGCVCTANYDPVCGTNDKTYSNSCEADCEGIAIKSKGLCEVPPTAKPSSTSDKAPLDVGSCVCPMVYKPVCTKKGKTRGNKCEAKCHGEEVEREGECEGEGAITSDGDKAAAQTDKSQTSLAVKSANDKSSKMPTADIPMKPPRRPNCVCIALYAPVCGKDGNTYSNKCEAKCHDMQVAREGECNSSKVDPIDGAHNGVHPGCNVCPSVFAPVCGMNGKTYGNKCEAFCRGKTEVAHKGPCDGDKAMEHTGVSGLDRCLEDCTVVGKPVCGVDRKRYPSACAAQCHKVDIAYPGDCNGDCAACPHQWYPYCANSAQYGPSTFANCCFAKCNNVAIIKQVLHAGVCLDRCGKCDPTLERPLCCKGRTYKNGCYAKCNEEDTRQCSLGRCSANTYVEKGLACLLGPCTSKCSPTDYDKPVCGSDGMTYPSQCSLMCSQRVAIVHEGKCGMCAPKQLPGGFPFCAADDRVGVSPVCGKDGVTYRNRIAATAANAVVASNGTCTGRMCGQQEEVCFLSGSEQSSCCPGYICTPVSTEPVQLEAHLAQKVLGGQLGVCKQASATLSA